MPEIYENVVDSVIEILQATGRDPATVTLEEAKQLTLAVIRNRRKTASPRVGKVPLVPAAHFGARVTPVCCAQLTNNIESLVR